VLTPSVTEYSNHMAESTNIFASIEIKFPNVSDENSLSFQLKSKCMFAKMLFRHHLQYSICHAIRCWESLNVSAVLHIKSSRLKFFRKSSCNGEYFCILHTGYHFKLQCSPHQLIKGCPPLFPAEKGVGTPLFFRKWPSKLFYPPLNASKWLHMP
jgi:hypothetical protein